MAAVFTKEALRGQHRDLRLSHRLPQRLIAGARRIQQSVYQKRRPVTSPLSHDTWLACQLDPNLIVRETGVPPKL
jgi:hypothetical protein